MGGETRIGKVSSHEHRNHPTDSSHNHNEGKVFCTRWFIVGKIGNRCEADAEVSCKKTSDQAAKEEEGIAVCENTDA